jgi:cell division inhibitor SepF
MSLSASLRAAVAQFGGARDDDYDDDYETGEYESPPSSASARDARPLALIQPRHVRFALVAPRDFDDAQQIADHVRAGDPVLVDLQACDAELRKRLTDFFSGLAYAVDGSVESVGDQVVLLAPPAVELSSGAAGEPHRRRFLNQA